MSIWHQDYIVAVKTFADRPQHSAGKSGSNFGAIWIVFEVNRNVLGVEIVPILSEFIGEVDWKVPVSSDETTFKAVVKKRRSTSRHDAVVLLAVQLMSRMGMVDGGM